MKMNDEVSACEIMLIKLKVSVCAKQEVVSVTGKENDDQA